MNRFNIILILLFFIGVSLRAQQFEGGVLAGMDFSQVDGDYYSGYNKLGFLAGAYVKLPVGENLALRLEMEYIQKGSVNHYNPNAVTGTNNTDYSQKTAYIEMPLVLEYNLETALAKVNMPEYLTKVRVYGGLGAGVLVFHEEFINDMNAEGLTPGFSSLELSFLAGLQYVISPRWRADFRWDIGITSIRTGEAPGYTKRFASTTYGQYNNLLAVGLFYKI
jgi:hypothetical protein